MVFDSTELYGRAFSLVVSSLITQKGLDLSEFRVKFSVKRSATMTPNTADIRVYNLSDETVEKVKKEFTQVILQAGYEGNFGVIFQGNIKQVLAGRESSTDTYIDIIAGDGDRAFQFAIVNASLAAGATQFEQLQTAMKPMKEMGVSQGYVQLTSFSGLPRGKVMYGNSINYLRNIATSTDQDWSIQDEKVQFVKLTTFLPGEVVKINSKTGLIGTPQQTNEGVNLKCLLNPLLKIAGRVQLENKEIIPFKIDLNSPNSPANVAAPFTHDGVYSILVAEHEGDTRGNPWYTSLVTLNVDVTTNPINSIFGGN